MLALKQLGETMRPPIIIGATVIVGLSLLGTWVLMLRPLAPSDALTSLRWIDNPSEIAASVELSRLAILTSENYVGHRIRVIEGAVINNSRAKTFKSIQIRLTFNNYDGASIQESEEEVLDKGRPLASGERGRFSFRFENLPNDWNYRVPIGEVIRIGY